MEKKAIIKQLIINSDKFTKKNFQPNLNFWELFIQRQTMLEKETMECLFILNRVYEDMFSTAKTGDFDRAIIQLNEAHTLRKSFEFDINTDTIFKIMYYPNIAYLQYRMKKVRSAQYYTKRTINLIKNNHYKDPIFLYRIAQQEINYVILYFESNKIEKGINHSLKSIIECKDLINECLKNKNYYKDYKQETVSLYNINLNVLLTRLCNEIKKNEEKVLKSNIINWKLVKNVSNLINYTELI